MKISQNRKNVSSAKTIALVAVKFVIEASQNTILTSAKIIKLEDGVK